MKRNFIKLIKEEKDGKVIYDTYLTPAFIPLRKMTQAIEFMSNKESEEDDAQMFFKMIDMVVDIYDNQFTKDDVLDRLHAPDAIRELQSQIQFVSEGQMSDERKKELAKMV